MAKGCGAESRIFKQKQPVSLICKALQATVFDNLWPVPCTLAEQHVGGLLCSHNCPATAAAVHMFWTLPEEYFP